MDVVVSSITVVVADIDDETSFWDSSLLVVEVVVHARICARFSLFADDKSCGICNSFG